ncbi:DUF2290 domain-containing protein [Sinorhizobium meliloti]|uniref:DUF2290 domain-containing protein n=1 Tax=Rhizobium meliloti TaxID=382 RepID=UPI00299D001B|nr:DUF2290 domain-containing protein [Sinorhizobium meliloti]MDW9387534.1 DUF2290 domain-containing protein [Sinorhizobium meliloti]MDW9541793.1 DUF2290 domain-containing protein [Sinorhizobium meliloti]MDW9602041.1 DUF2290 domain-containing protein [Sinorhizobium meliloti]MDX0530438.1 DUF2290 domain-containing protein [Sinorhizobium medicae]
MTRDEFNASIRAIHNFFDSENFVESTVYLVNLPRSEEFNQTSLTTLDYNSVYEVGLSLSHYNFVLKDLAYFQFSHSAENEWALAYYPNPRVSGSPDALVEFNELKDAADRGEIDDEEFSSLASGLHVGYYIPRVRFEYSESQYRRVRHPGAHFHIGMSGEDRWASSRKLSPRTFGLLIAKLYYPDLWWKNSRFSLAEEDQELPRNIENCVDEKLVSSIRNDGVSQSFSAFERLTFHFGAFQPGPAA